MTSTATLRKQLSDARKALEALEAALADNGRGNFWLCREYLRKLGEYDGDLSSCYLLERVAQRGQGKP